MRKLLFSGLLCVAATVAVSVSGAQPDERSPLAQATASDAGDTPPADNASPEEAPLSPELLRLRDRIRNVLAVYYHRRLNTGEHTPWEMMHGVVAYGLKTQAEMGGPGGPVENAVGWLCYNRAFKGRRLLTVSNDLPRGLIGVGLQGHHGQLLAILAQINLTRDYPMRIAGRSFTLEDLIRGEQRTCRPGEEQTFKLIGLIHYLPTDTTWTSDDGREWDFQRLIREEIGAPIQAVAACGGTHRLMGLDYAVRKRSKEGKPVVGEFERAQIYTEEYHKFALALRNPDGSFSTQWLEHREARPDIDRRMQTSGHILEWLVFALPEERLVDPDFVRSVNYVTTLLERHPDRDWQVGPLGHALRSLRLYDERVFRTAPPVDDSPEEAQPDSEKEIAESKIRFAPTTQPRRFKR